MILLQNIYSVAAPVTDDEHSRLIRVTDRPKAEYYYGYVRIVDAYRVFVIVLSCIFVYVFVTDAGILSLYQAVHVPLLLPWSVCSPPMGTVTGKCLLLLNQIETVCY